MEEKKQSDDVSNCTAKKRLTMDDAKEDNSTEASPNRFVRNVKRLKTLYVSVDGKKQKLL